MPVHATKKLHKLFFRSYFVRNQEKTLQFHALQVK